VHPKEPHMAVPVIHRHRRFLALPRVSSFRSWPCVTGSKFPVAPRPGVAASRFQPSFADVRQPLPVVAAQLPI
jgi:hypothetical protein